MTPITELLLVLVMLTAVSMRDSSAADGQLDSAEFIKTLRRASQNPDRFRPKLDANGFEFIESLLDARSARQWSRLFRIVDEQLDPLRNQLVLLEDGIWIPLDEFCRRLMRDLPAEGKETVQLHLDARAKAALRLARSTTDIQSLYRLYRESHSSPRGAEIAHQLAGALFQNGDFLEAASIWQSLLENYPSTGPQEPRIMLMRATAYQRAGDRLAAESMVERLRSHYPNETASIGGSNVNVVQYADALLSLTETAATTTVSNDPTLGLDDQASWQWSTFWPEIAGRKYSSAAAYGSIDNVRLVHLGHKAAGFNRRTGKLEWIVEAPKILFVDDVETLMPNARIRGMIGRDTRVDDPALLKPPSDPIGGDGKFFLRLQAVDHDGSPSSSAVVAAVDASTGRIAWSTESTLPDARIVSDACSGNQCVYLLARHTFSDQLTLFALNQTNGQVAWSIPLGSLPSVFRTNSQEVSTAMHLRGHRLIVALDDQAISSINTIDRSIRWLNLLGPDPENNAALIQRGVGRPLIVRGRMRFIVGAVNGYLSVRVSGNDVVAYDSSRQSLICYDDNLGRIRWKTELPSSELVFVKAGSAYLLTDDKLIAVDLSTGMETWTLGIENHFRSATQIGRYLIVPAREGVHSIDLETREERVIRPIPDIGVVQRVLQDGQSVVAVSNEMITIFSLRSSGESTGNE